MVFFRRILCVIGWHSWEFKDDKDALGVVTLARCRNPNCDSHKLWVTVDRIMYPW
jgi:hypothetical protein